MTFIERMYALYNAVNYILDNYIDGDFVECGVYKGGSSMLIALIFVARRINNRRIFLYDTFEGMSMPTEKDSKTNGTSKEIAKKWKSSQTQSTKNWSYSSEQEVLHTMNLTLINKKQVELIKGMVENTIPNNFHCNIALLRLDTDWYESTMHELKNLFPLLNEKEFC